MMNYYSYHPHSNIELVIFVFSMNNPANLVICTVPSMNEKLNYYRNDPMNCLILIIDSETLQALKAVGLGL